MLLAYIRDTCKLLTIRAMRDHLIFFCITRSEREKKKYGTVFVSRCTKHAGRIGTDKAPFCAFRSKVRRLTRPEFSDHERQLRQAPNFVQGGPAGVAHLRLVVRVLGDLVDYLEHGRNPRATSHLHLRTMHNSSAGSA